MLYEKLIGDVGENEDRHVIGPTAGLLRMYVNGHVTRDQIKTRLVADEHNDFDELMDKLDALSSKSVKRQCLDDWFTYLITAEHDRTSPTPVIADTATLKSLMLAWTP